MESILAEHLSFKEQLQRILLNLVCLRARPDDRARPQDSKFSSGIWEYVFHSTECASSISGRIFASGFLAVDPGYDFSKFGEDKVAWIEKFKVDEAVTIKAKRIKLRIEAGPLEGDEDVSFEDAPPDGEQDVKDQGNQSPKANVFLEKPLDDAAKTSDISGENTSTPLADDTQGAS